jgi:hypothetical protein
MTLPESEIKDSAELILSISRIDAAVYRQLKQTAMNLPELEFSLNKTV